MYIILTIRFLLIRETVASCCKNHTKDTNTLYDRMQFLKCYSKWYMYNHWAMIG